MKTWKIALPTFADRRSPGINKSLLNLSTKTSGESTSYRNYHNSYEVDRASRAGLGSNMRETLAQGNSPISSSKFITPKDEGCD